MTFYKRFDIVYDSRRYSGSYKMYTKGDGALVVFTTFNGEDCQQTVEISPHSVQTHRKFWSSIFRPAQ